MVDCLEDALSALTPTMLQVEHVVSADVKAASEEGGGAICCGGDGDGVCGGGDGVRHVGRDDGAVEEFEEFTHNALKYVKKSDGEEEGGGELKVVICNRCGKIMSNRMLSPIGVVKLERRGVWCAHGKRGLLRVE